MNQVQNHFLVNRSPINLVPVTYPFRRRIDFLNYWLVSKIKSKIVIKIKTMCKIEI